MSSSKRNFLGDDQKPGFIFVSILNTVIDGQNIEQYCIVLCLLYYILTFGRRGATLYRLPRDHTYPECV